MEPARPNLNLCICIDDKWHQIGVAWTNENGSVRIQVNPLVQIPTGPIGLTLFVNKEKTFKPKAKDDMHTFKPSEGKPIDQPPF